MRKKSQPVIGENNDSLKRRKRERGRETDRQTQIYIFVERTDTGKDS